MMYDGSSVFSHFRYLNSIKHIQIDQLIQSVIFLQEFPSPPKELGFIFASLQKAKLWPIYILIPRKCILESCKRLKPLNFLSGKYLLGKCKTFLFKHGEMYCCIISPFDLNYCYEVRVLLFKYHFSPIT